MKHFARKYYFLLPISILLSIVAACASKPVVTEKKPVQAEIRMLIKGAPDWVNKGSSIFILESERVFHGVALASPMGDMAQQKSVADDRARAEVVRLYSLYVAAVLNDYFLTNEQQDTAPADKELLVRQVENLTKINFAAIRIIGSWRDSQTNIIWSRAALGMQEVRRSFAGDEALGEGFKRYFEVNADKVLDRLIK